MHSRIKSCSDQQDERKKPETHSYQTVVMIIFLSLILDTHVVIHGSLNQSEDSLGAARKDSVVFTEMSRMGKGPGEFLGLHYPNNLRDDLLSLDLR